MKTAAPDRYRTAAPLYDRVIEPFTRSMRRASLALFRPHPGSVVLDLGCGTGTQLALYRSLGCATVGLDPSRAMLHQAQQKVGDRSTLVRAFGTGLPFAPGRVDLVTLTLCLHEMAPEVRHEVLEEVKRVLKPDGKILCLDYRLGPVTFPRGWFYRGVATLFEILAGVEHYRHYRDFQRTGGFEGLSARHGLDIAATWILGHGCMALFLASPRRPADAQS